MTSILFQLGRVVSVHDVLNHEILLPDYFVGKNDEIGTIQSIYSKISEM